MATFETGRRRTRIIPWFLGILSCLAIASVRLIDVSLLSLQPRETNPPDVSSLQEDSTEGVSDLTLMQKAVDLALLTPTTRDTDVRHPLVSIIIPSYNRPHYLPATLASMYAQTYPNIEVLLIDDHSTNVTEWMPRLLRQFPKLRVAFTDQPCGNPYCARNRGLQLARGEYIGFCDDDDAWLPEKLRVQVRAMQQQRLPVLDGEDAEEHRILFSVTDAVLPRDRSTLPHCRYTAETWNATTAQCYNGAAYRRAIKSITGNSSLPEFWDHALTAKHNWFVNSAVLLHRNLTAKVGYFQYDPRASRGSPAFSEDWGYWLRALEHTPYALFIRDCLTFYTTCPRWQWHHADVTNRADQK